MMSNEIKNKFIHKLARWTRDQESTRFDAALRLLYNPDKRQQDAIDCIITSRDGGMFHINTASYLEWMLFFYGTYEPFIQKLIRQFVQAGDVCIDVGANIGIHAATMARATGRTGQVIAFEPHPQLVPRLEENMLLNHFDWVTVEPRALSDQQGTATLYSFDGRDSNQGTSTLCKGLNGSSKTFSVDMVTLDDYCQQQKIKRIDFIKIDVEGHELAVIAGAQQTIHQLRPTILFEHNRQLPEDTHTIMDTLSQQSYRFYAVYYHQIVPLSASQKSIDASNILAIPNRQ